VEEELSGMKEGDAQQKTGTAEPAACADDYREGRRGAPPIRPGAQPANQGTNGADAPQE